MDELYAEPEKVRIFPVVEGSCPECGAVHDAKMPHYCGSVYYQMRFQQKFGRAPVWNDAMSHCAKPMQETFQRYLREKGVREEDISGEKKPNRGKTRNGRDGPPDPKGGDG